MSVKREKINLFKEAVKSGLKDADLPNGVALNEIKPEIQKLYRQGYQLSDLVAIVKQYLEADVTEEQISAILPQVKSLEHPRTRKRSKGKKGGATEENGNADSGNAEKKAAKEPKPDAPVKDKKPPEPPLYTPDNVEKWDEDNSYVIVKGTLGGPEIGNRMKAPSGRFVVVSKVEQLKSVGGWNGGPGLKIWFMFEQ